MGSYFRFFLCVCVCGETLFLYVRTEAVQSEIGQSLDYTPGYVDVMDTPTFWAKNTPISPVTPPSASRIIPVFRQQAIPIVFCAGTLHSTRIPFLNVDYRAVNTMKYTYLTRKNIELSTPCLQVLDSPDMLRWRVPTLDLVSDDEDANAQPVPESVSCLRPPRWRRGILHPPAGSVIEMDLPNVTVEDCFCGSMVYILNKCVNGMKDPIYLQSCTHAFDITPMSSWQAFANWFMPIFVSYIFARNFCPHAILEELFRLPIYWQAHCAGRQCPNWATSFLSGFDWTSARLEALLASVLQPDVDPEPLVMNVTPSNTDWSEENDDVTPRDMEVDMDSVDDPVDAALERDLLRWEEQRDRTPSPPPSMSSAPHPQPSMSSAPDPQPSMSSAHAPQPSMSSGPDPQIEATISSRLNRVFKWGNCSVHKSCSLQPHVLGPTSREPGVIKLYCSKWFKVESGGQRGCWFSQPFPRERYSELGMVHKQKYQDLRLAMKRNAKRPGAE